MVTDFNKRADELIEQLKAAQISPTSEVYLVFLYAAADGTAKSPHKILLSEPVQVQAPHLDPQDVKESAYKILVATMIGNINSLVRHLKPHVLYRSAESPIPCLRYLDVELEINDFLKGQ